MRFRMGLATLISAVSVVLTFMAIDLAWADVETEPIAKGPNNICNGLWAKNGDLQAAMQYIQGRSILSNLSDEDQITLSDGERQEILNERHSLMEMFDPDDSKNLVVQRPLIVMNAPQTNLAMMRAGGVLEIAPPDRP